MVTLGILKDIDFGFWLKSNEYYSPNILSTNVRTGIKHVKKAGLINELVKDSSGGDLLTWASTDGLNVVSKVKPLDPKFKSMFSGAASLSGKPRNDLVANIVAGFSAAIGVKNFIKKMGDNVDIVENVYLTGAKWPPAVEKFQLKNENSGFDYNSSDFVVEVDSKTFYGISLKKKHRNIPRNIIL